MAKAVIKKKTVTKKKTKKAAKVKSRISSPSPPLRMTAQDRKWQAEDDARTLARAEDVKNDPSRIKAAKVQAKQMAKEKEKELTSIRKIMRQ